MTVTISTADPRTVKGLAILTTADRWVRGHRKDDGRSFFAITSASGHIYYVDTRECTCPDHVNRGVVCKHILAVRLWIIEQKGAQAAPTARLELQWTPCACGTLIDPTMGRQCPQCVERKPGSRYREIFGDE